MIRKTFLFLLFLPVCAVLSAVDYALPENWLVSEHGKKNTEFDVFYIHPTLLKDEKNPYPDFKNPAVRKRLTTFSSAQAGIFGNKARIFVPAVRQLEFSRCIRELKQNQSAGIAKNSMMYRGVQDAVDAFKFYLKKWNPQGKRPYILFGHSQGAVELYEVLRQVKEISPDRGFVAAYLPGLPRITAKKIQKDLGRRNILPAKDEGSTGVIIVWHTQLESCRNNLFTAGNGYGINPLNWRTDDRPAPASMHRGMILFDHRAGAPLLYMSRYAKPAACSAKLGSDGALIVSDVHPAALKLFNSGNGCCHGGDIWMFTGNIVENAILRTGLYRMKKDLDKAKSMIRSGKAECVLLRNGRIAEVERGRGVSPLLRLFDRKKESMKNAVVVDKVIGRAAAAIAICGKAAFVHGEIMSEDAQEFLKAHNIPSSCNLMVHRILNRKRDGLCPLEQSVQGISDPEEALKSLRKRIAQLMKQAKKR